MSLKKIHNYLLLCGFCLIFVLFNGCDINQSQSKESKKEINVSIPKIKEDPIYAKLSELKTQLNSGKSYIAYQKYVDMLKQSPSQRVIDKIARSTGEETYTISLAKIGYLKYAMGKWESKGPIFSEDGKKVYYMEYTKENNREIEKLCEINLENGKKRIIINQGRHIESFELTGKNQMSLIIYGSTNRYKIPAVNINNKKPYRYEDIRAMNPMYSHKEYKHPRQQYEGIKIHGSHHIRASEGGSSVILFMADSAMIEEAGFKPNCEACRKDPKSCEGGTLGDPAFSADGSKIVFTFDYECSNKLALMIADFDGQNARLLCKDEDIKTPHFSRDGEFILYAKYKFYDTSSWHAESKSSINMFDLTKNQRQTLTRDSHYNYAAPSLSYDSKKIVYVASQGPEYYRRGYVVLKYIDRKYTAEELLKRFDRVEVKQRAVFDLLRDIKNAQDDYKRLNRRYAKSISELVENKCLPDAIRPNMYDFNIIVTGGIHTYNIAISPEQHKNAGNITFRYDLPDKLPTFNSSPTRSKGWRGIKQNYFKWSTDIRIPPPERGIW